MHTFIRDFKKKERARENKYTNPNALFEKNSGWGGRECSSLPL